jgi:hypothetical protein
MLLKMITTAVGANDGITAKKYIKDHVYELSDTLSNCFLDMQVARAAKPTEKVNGKGKAVDEREILNKQMQELHNKDAADQLSNKKDEQKDDKEAK